MRNNNGFTLFELIISVLVSSIVLVILIQILVMTITVRNDVYVDNRLRDESYYMLEELKWYIFDLQTQKVTITEDANTITITFLHEYDVIVDSGTGVISYEASTVPAETLVYYKDNGQANAGEIHYEGTRLHPESVFFTTGTSISVSAINSSCDPTVGYCADVVVTLDLYISFETDTGVIVDPVQLKTTIIV